jgi:hypothetical protein
MRCLEAHTGFEPVLPPNAGGKPDSGSRGQAAPGSGLNPHLQAVLERLKERTASVSDEGGGTSAREVG